MPFDERSHILVTLAVESFGVLGQEGSEVIGQVAAIGQLAVNIVGGTDGRSLSRKGL